MPSVACIALVVVTLLGAALADAQNRRARVPIEGDLIACVQPSEECGKTTPVRVKVGDREIVLGVLNILQITNQLSVPQILTELRRFRQTAMGPKEILDELVPPKPLKIRAIIRMEARTLFIQLVQPASRVDMQLSE
jgi:hypothetical protein